MCIDWPTVQQSEPRSTKAIVTVASGRAEELFAISRPTFEAYAARHNYDIILGDGSEAKGRPPAWAKVALLLDILAEYELLLWLDVDLVISDGREDIARDLHAGDVHGLVQHQNVAGLVPNTGVWLLRGELHDRQLSRRLLEDIWRAEEFTEHPWWENAALMSLLGYDLPPGRCRPVHYSEYMAHTTWLPKHWNGTVSDGINACRIRHYAGVPHDLRLQLMSSDVRALDAARLTPAGSS